ncbi:MAG: hypothetical protein HY821_12160 [Acidobacteria bacterium]|nr:hypothetical protein [Acidobacteriota bacterium]
MGPTLEQLAARLDDPETPIIWLDPSLPEEIWSHLPGAISGRGFTPLPLEPVAHISDMASLVTALAATACSPLDPPPDQSALRSLLLHLPLSGHGWVILFRNPESLRQNDEIAFEDFVEAVSQANEQRISAGRQPLKLIVRD